MKNILILAIDCNNEACQKLTNTWMPRWASKCDEYDNIDWFSFKSSEGSPESINYETHTILVDAPDGYCFQMFEKNSRCLEYLDEQGVLGKYDYIFRTNNSSWVNVELLNMFVQSLADDDPTVYAPTIHVRPEFKPFTMAPQPQGNGIIIPIKYWKIITVAAYEDYERRYRLGDRTDLLDDQAIGRCLCCMCLDQNKDPFSIMKSYGRFSVCLRHAKTVLGDPNPAGYGPDNITQFIIVVCKDFIRRRGAYPQQCDDEMFEWTEKAFAECKEKPSLEYTSKRLNEDLIYLSISQYCDRLVPKSIVKSILMLNTLFARTYGRFR